MHTTYSRLKNISTFGFFGSGDSTYSNGFYLMDDYYRAQLSNFCCGDCAEYTYASGKQEIYGDGSESDFMGDGRIWSIINLIIDEA